MSDAVAFCRALSDLTRWRIVQMATREALCVCELAGVLDMPQSSVSSHVQVLRRAGLLESEKCEKWTYFRILPQHHQLIRTLAAHFTGRSDAVAREDWGKLKRRLKERAGSCCPGPQKLATISINSPLPREKR